MTITWKANWNYISACVWTLQTSSPSPSSKPPRNSPSYLAPSERIIVPAIKIFYSQNLRRIYALCSKDCAAHFSKDTYPDWSKWWDLSWGIRSRDFSLEYTNWSDFFINLRTFSNFLFRMPSCFCRVQQLNTLSMSWRRGLHKASRAPGPATQEYVCELNSRVTRGIHLGHRGNFVESFQEGVPGKARLLKSLRSIMQ